MCGWLYFFCDLGKPNSPPPVLGLAGDPCKLRVLGPGKKQPEDGGGTGRVCGFLFVCVWVCVLPLRTKKGGGPCPLRPLPSDPAGTKQHKTRCWYARGYAKAHSPFLRQTARAFQNNKQQENVSTGFFCGGFSLLYQHYLAHTVTISNMQHGDLNVR